MARRLTRPTAVAAWGARVLRRVRCRRRARRGVRFGDVERRAIACTGQARTGVGAGRRLHRTLTVVDLHADSLLWGRDLRRRVGYGHLDIPRLIEGGVALEAWPSRRRSRRHVNLDRNDDRTDDVTLLALGQRWPPRDLGEPRSPARSTARSTADDGGATPPVA